MASSQEIFEGETPDQRKRRLNREKLSRHYKKQKNQHITGINLLDEQQYINIRRHELGRMDQISSIVVPSFGLMKKIKVVALHFHLLLYAVLVVRSIYHLCLNHHHIY